MAAGDVSNLDILINEQLILDMTTEYQGKKVLDSLFGSGVEVRDEYSQVNGVDAMFKAPTFLVKPFDGKAKKLTIPIAPRATGIITTLSETGAPDEVAYVPTEVDFTPVEIGNFKATITGLAQLQVYTPVTAAMLKHIVAMMADTKEQLISTRVFAGGTKAVSEAADKVRYFQVGPVSQGANIFKPDGFLKDTDIIEASVRIADVAEPFDNGLFLGVIHKEQIPTLRALAGSSLREFQLYAASSPFPSNQRMGIIGVWEGIMWVSVDNALAKIAAGAHDTTPAYKTAIFGKNFLGKAYVPPQMLPLADPAVTQLPFDDFVIRIAPTTSDVHRRGMSVAPYMYVDYEVAMRNAGLYIVAKSNFSTSQANLMA